MNSHRFLKVATVLVATAALVACWGGSDDDEVVVPPVVTVAEVPDSAGVSPSAFVAFILGLPGNDESSEPLVLKNGFAVPDDEAAEPTPLT